MTRLDKVSELAHFIMAGEAQFKGMSDVEYQLYRLDLEDEIHRKIENWLEASARGE